MPYPRSVLRVARTSVMMWLLGRAAYTIAVLSGAETFELFPGAQGLEAALQPAGISRAVVVLVASFLVWLQRRIGHEHLLQANFGVASAWFVATSLAAAGTADIVVQAILSAV